MQDFYGTYRGLTPLAESAVGAGELRIVVEADKVTMTVATGSEVQEDSLETSVFKEMTAAEIAADFNAGTDLTGIRGIAIAANPQEGVRLLVMPGGPEDETCVVLRGLFGEEMCGHSYLFTPEQVKAGKFDEMVKAIEDEHGTAGVVPLIENGGRAPRTAKDGE
jgi:hypothetical protein